MKESLTTQDPQSYNITLPVYPMHNVMKTKNDAFHVYAFWKMFC